MISRPTASSPAGSLLLQNRFGVLLSGNFVSAVGTHVRFAVASWLMFQMTKSSAMVGTLTLANQAPAIALTIPAGIVADALDRRRWLVTVHGALVAFAAVLALITWTGRLSPVLLLAVTAAMGIGNTFVGPAWIAIVTDVVPASRAMSAFALNSMSYHLAAALGPVLGAFLFSVVGAAPAFGLNSASFLAVIAALLALRIRRESRRAPGVRRALEEIVRFARGSVRSRRLVPASGAVALLALGITAVLPAYASEMLEGSSRTFGSLMGAYGAGSLCGAVALALMANRSARRTAMVAGSWVVAVGALLLVGGRAETAFPGALALGAGQLMFLVTSRTVIQLDAPEDLRARAVSLWYVAVVGLGPLGGFVLGWTADRLGLERTLAIAAVYGALVALATTVGARGRTGLVRPYEASAIEHPAS